MDGIQYGKAQTTTQTAWHDTLWCNSTQYRYKTIRYDTIPCHLEIDIFFKCNSLDDSQQCMFMWIPFTKYYSYAINESKWEVSKCDVTLFEGLCYWVESEWLSDWERVQKNDRHHDGILCHLFFFFSLLIVLIYAILEKSSSSIVWGDNQYTLTKIEVADMNIRLKNPMLCIISHQLTSKYRKNTHLICTCNLTSCWFAYELITAPCTMNTYNGTHFLLQTSVEVFLGSLLRLYTRILSHYHAYSSSITKVL